MTTPAQSKNWVIYPTAPDSFFESVTEHRLLAQVLYNRGMQSSEEVNAFLTLDDAIRENPYKLKDMTLAVTRIVKAIETGETICVYGDFDADGVTATALLGQRNTGSGRPGWPLYPRSGR